MQKKIIDAIKKPGEMVSGAIKTIKGQDVETLIEEFTNEVALVIEGVSDDQERLAAENKVLKEKLNSVSNRLTELERNLKQTSKTGLIRQITWLVAIIAVTLIVLSVTRLFN